MQLRSPSVEMGRELCFDPLVYAAKSSEAIDHVGADRIVLGTDYPFPVASQDPQGDLDAVSGLSEGEKNAMLGETAARLLKIAWERIDLLVALTPLS